MMSSSISQAAYQHLFGAEKTVNSATAEKLLRIYLYLIHTFNYKVVYPADAYEDALGIMRQAWRTLYQEQMELGQQEQLKGF